MKEANILCANALTFWQSHFLLIEKRAIFQQQLDRILWLFSGLWHSTLCQSFLLLGRLRIWQTQFFMHARAQRRMTGIILDSIWITILKLDYYRSIGWYIINNVLWVSCRVRLMTQIDEFHDDGSDWLSMPRPQWEWELTQTLTT
jgi:hypothetical protein